MSLTLPKKNVGDLFYADEFNLIVNAINDNDTEINKVDKKIDNKREYIATNIVTDDIEVSNLIKDSSSNSYKLKENAGEADYTLVTDVDLLDYVKLNDDTLDIIVKNVLTTVLYADDMYTRDVVINSSIELRSPVDEYSSTIADISGTYDEDLVTPIVTFGDSSPILRNVGEPILQNDAVTKNYVDEQFKILYKKLGLEWQQ